MVSVNWDIVFYQKSTYIPYINEMVSQAHKTLGFILRDANVPETQLFSILC